MLTRDRDTRNPYRVGWGQRCRVGVWRLRVRAQFPHGGRHQFAARVDGDAKGNEIDIEVGTHFVRFSQSSPEKAVKKHATAYLTQGAGVVHDPRPTPGDRSGGRQQPSLSQRHLDIVSGQHQSQEEVPEGVNQQAKMGSTHAKAVQVILPAPSARKKFFWISRKPKRISGK